MKAAFTVLAIIAGSLCLVGFLGSVHPMFDAIAIGRWVAICVMLLFLFLRAALGGQFVAAALTLGVFIVVAGMSRTNFDGEAGSVRIYTKNLWYANDQVAAVVADIQAMNPDVVFLQEVSETNRAILSELEELLPYQSLCPWQGWNGIAILSRWPFEADARRCSPERSLMARRVLRPEGSFWAVGVHLQQPWPDIQWQHLEQGLPVLDGIDDGAIVAGDFNTVPWSAAARKIGKLTGTNPVPLRQPTFRLWGVGLPLDQVWALGGRAVRRPQNGSDHFGVAADVWPSEGRGG